MPDGDALAKIFGAEVALMYHAASFQIGEADGRVAVAPCPFVKDAAVKNESLGKCVGIVGIGLDDLIGVGRGLGGRNGRIGALGRSNRRKRGGSW